MSHLQPPEPQPSMNSERPTYERPREGQPSQPLSREGQASQPLRREGQPSQPVRREGQASQPLRREGQASQPVRREEQASQPLHQQNTPQPQYPDYPEYQPEPQHPQPSPYPRGPQPPQYPENPPYPQNPEDQPKQPQSTRIRLNPPQLQSTRIAQNPPLLPYPVQAPASYKQTPTYPPYQIQQPQPYPASYPEKKSSQRILPRRDYSRWIIVTLVSGVLALLIIGGLTLVGNNGIGTAGTGPQSNPTTGATGSQSGPPTGTTPPNSGQQGPQPIFGPVLGGTVSNFVLQYGVAQDPTNNEAGLWQYLTIAGQPVSLSVSTAPAQDSRDGDLHVMNLIVQTTSNGNWNAATQQHIMAALLPPDAKLVHQVSTANGNEIVYTSARLSATFQSDVFANDAGKTVTPGTFNEQCFLAGTAVPAGGAATSCWLAVGEI